PSHVFGEFYLDPIDRTLSAYGIDHIRYLDDIRIFANSYKAAKQQLQELSRLLRDRGLNLQTAKTEILSASKAKGAGSGNSDHIRSGNSGHPDVSTSGSRLAVENSEGKDVG